MQGRKGGGGSRRKLEVGLFLKRGGWGLKREMIAAITAIFKHAFPLI